MPETQLTDEELLAYLDEQLPVERSAEVERQLRAQRDLRQRAALLARRRDSGDHTLGEIWRREQLSCPNRETLGMFLLGVADPAMEDYIIFHSEVVGCRICLANLNDLREANSAASAEGPKRQQRYFESSAGVLRSHTSPPATE